MFLACIALGVMAIAGVGSFAHSLADGLTRDGRVILGGDLAFSLIHREASPQERLFLASRGQVSLAATLRAMGRASDGRASLVEIKAVDSAYPLYGAVRLEGADNLIDALAVRDGVHGAVADEALFARLDLAPGARLGVGNIQVEVRAVLKSEPDKLAGGIGFGPRLLIGEEALRATGLLQPGSLVRWHYRVKLARSDVTDRAADAVVEAARAALPDAGWDVRTRNKASPQLERNIERFTQFLTLVGLTALLVGGVGVANAVKAHLDRKRPIIATMKSLGATGGRVFAIYLIQVMALALVGSVIGLVLGAGLPFLVAWGFGALIPVPIEPAVQPQALGLSLVYGLITALAFALWPLGRAHDVPAAALFRDEVAPERRSPRRRYAIATALAVAALALLAVFAAYDRRIAEIFVGAAAAGVRRIAPGGDAGDGARAARAAAALDRAAACDRQHPSPGRADADGGPLARPRPRRAGDRHVDRRQPAPPAQRRAAGARAFVLFRRYPIDRRRTVRRLRAPACARRRARSRADAARSHRRP